MTLQTRPFHTLAALALLTSSITSCDPPIDPEVDSGLLADHVASVFEGAARAVRAMDEAPTTGGKPENGMARLASRLLGGEDPTDQPVRPPAQAGRAMRNGLAGREPASEPGYYNNRLLGALRRLMEDELAGASIGRAKTAAPRTLASRTQPPPGDQITEDARELRWIIKERLLTRNNIEGQDPVQVTYRLRPEVTCIEPHGTQLDEDCARFLGRVEVRLRMTRDLGGHELQLQVGARRVHPLTFNVQMSQITATVDLQAFKSAAEVVATQLEEPDPGLPTVMRGTFRLELNTEGTRTANLHLSLLDMIEIRDDQERSAFRTAAADPALSLRLDGEARKIESVANVGLTEVITPVDDNVRRTGSPDLRVVVAGLIGRGTVDLTAEKLVFEKVGLGPGPSYAEVRGQRVVQLDLNPQDQRKLDATVTFAPDGTPRLAIAPRFDLDLMFKLMLIKAELSSPPPAHLEDESYRLLVDGAGGQGPVLEAFEDELHQRSGVRVVSGRVSLSSTKAAVPVTATAGQCLEPREAAPGDHPILGSVQVTTCP